MWLLGDVSEESGAAAVRTHHRKNGKWGGCARAWAGAGANTAAAQRACKYDEAYRRGHEIDTKVDCLTNFPSSICVHTL